MNVVSKLKASRPVAMVVMVITARNTRGERELRIAQKVTLRWKAMRVGRRRGLGGHPRRRRRVGPGLKRLQQMMKDSFHWFTTSATS